MFHRPPSINPAFEQESRKNSYNVPDDDLNSNKKLIKQNDSEDVLNRQTSVLEKLNSETIKLPDELVKEFDEFINFLKAPKFNRPLNLDDISQLYQAFYDRFNEKSVEYWTRHYEYQPHAETELLSREEIEDRNEKLVKIKNSVYLSNLLIEKLVCTKYYKKIFKSDKNLLKDEFNKLMNIALKNKLAKLSELPLTLQNLDLDLDLTNEQELIDLLAPVYQEMFEIRSPTLKLLKFKKVHEVINQFLKKINVKINGDFYLPILIYSIIKMKDPQEYDLILELNFIKNFKNRVIYENSSSTETGELLYILTNFDACLIYLLNVTITDLKLTDTPPQIDDILEKPIMIDEASLTYCDDYTIMKKEIKNNSALDYYSTRLHEYAFYNADQGIRTIGNVFDSSVKSIFGRFLPSTTSSASEIDKETLSQIEENFTNKLDEEVISPVSTTSTLNTSNSSSSNSNTATLQQQQQQSSAPAPPAAAPAMAAALQVQHQRSSSNDMRNSPLKNLSSSMSGVMKQFRPISASNSSTSLQTSLEVAQEQPKQVRSRGASLIGDVFNQPSRSSSASFINTIEHAFEGRRSRGNSLLGGSSNNVISDLKKEFKEEHKRFEDMSISELKKMYENYTKIMNS